MDFSTFGLKSYSIRLLFILLIFTSCTNQNQISSSKVESPKDVDTTNHTKKYSLEETKEFANILEKSIEYCNMILDDSLRIKLAASGTRLKDSVVEIIPVYNVKISPSGKFGIGFCPLIERCIFIDALQIPLLQKYFFDEKLNPDTAQYSDVPAEHLLTIILLHELGHLTSKDSLKLTAALNNKSNGGKFNIDDNQLKAEELKADKFAAQQLYIGSEKNHQLASILSLQLMKTLLTSGAYQILKRARTADSLGVMSDSKELSHLVVDSSYTHYNMEMRILQMARVLSPKRFSDSVVLRYYIQRNQAIRSLDSINR